MKYRSELAINEYTVRSDDYLECLSRSWYRVPSPELQSGWGSRIKACDPTRKETVTVLDEIYNHCFN